MKKTVVPLSPVSPPSPKAWPDKLCIVGGRWAGEGADGSSNTFLCDVNADQVHPAPSAFNLPSALTGRASAG